MSGSTPSIWRQVGVSSGHSDTAAESADLTARFELGYAMKVGEILELLKRDGWYLARMRGSHRQFKHPGKAGLVTVAGKPGDDLAPGTLNSILKQTSLKK